MNCSKRLIAQLKNKLNTTNNSDIARFLNISKTLVFNLTKQDASLGWEQVFKIIDFLGLDEQKIVFEMLEEKNTNYRLFKALEGKKQSRKSV